MLVWDVVHLSRYIHSFLHKHGSGGSSSRADDENFKISDYFYHTFFHLRLLLPYIFSSLLEQSCRVGGGGGGGLLSPSEQIYWVSFGQKLPRFFLDLGRSDRGC